MARRVAAWIIGLAACLAVGAYIGWRLEARAAKRAVAAELAAAEDALRRDDPAKALDHLNAFHANQSPSERSLFLSLQALRRTDAYSDYEKQRSDSRTYGFRTTDALSLEDRLVAVQQGDLADHEEALLASIRNDDPDRDLILEALAKGYLASYRLPDVPAVLDPLLERRPDHPRARLLRGLVFENQKKYEPAEKDYRRAIQILPNRPEGHAALGRLLLTTGHPREAAETLERALALGSVDPLAHLNLARAMTEQADLDAAERQLEALLKIDRDHPDGLVERGRLALRRDRPADAEPHLRRAVRLAPWHREAHELYRDTLRDLDREADATAIERQLATLIREDGLGGKLKLRARNAPDDVEVRLQLWEWAERNGLREEAVSWITEALRLDRQNLRAHAAFAAYYDRTGQPTLAARHVPPSGRVP